jgi:acyl-CoA synthetase (NDP forming)/RimJ/RimL family protein N-acetyltransferase
VSGSRLTRLLAPRSIALIGASDRPGSLGTPLTRQVLDSGFTGAVHLVNRERVEVAGRPCLRSVDELPAGVDLAVLLTPGPGLPQMVEDLAERGVGGAVIISVAASGGWGWSSRAGLLGRLHRRIRKTGMPVIGPASQGLALAALGLNLSLCPALPPAGGIGFVSNSGAVAGVIADWTAQRGIGMSALVSLGDALDVDIAEVLDHYAADPGTRAVLVHIEDLGAARRLLSAARALAARKPVVLLAPSEAGRAPADPDAGWSDEVRAAAFRRAGLLQVNDLEEFCAAANVDLPAWPHAGSRFAIAGNGQALGALAADAVRATGGELASLTPATLQRLRRALPARAAVGNPLDLQRDADAVRYRAAVAALAADPGADVVLVLHHPTSFSRGVDIAAALEPVAEGQALVLAAFAGAEQQAARRVLAGRQVAAFASPESAVRAYGLNRRYYRHKAELLQTPPPLLRWPRLDPVALTAARQRHADEPQRLLPALLAAAGIEGRWQPGEARQAMLGLRCHPQLGPQAHARRDGQWRVECLPLDRLRAARLVRHALGAEASADLAAQLESQLLLAAELVLAEPAIRRLEWGDPAHGSQGEVQASLAFEWSEDAPVVAPAFAPYPDHLRRHIEPRQRPDEWADGRPLVLRAIRAEDEPALREGFTRLSPEEVRMRFLYPLKAMTHDLAARLTQLDYDRELALVLADDLPAGQARLYGVVRASFDAPREEAEFAIVIPRVLSGQGLGTLMLGRLIELCRAAGLRRIVGDTLPENAPMRALARKLGFSEELRDHLMRLSLEL